MADFNSAHTGQQIDEGISKTTNIDNTSDLNKPVSIAQQEALNAKADAADLNNVDNTSDLNKPISIATQEALSLKINLVDFEHVDNTSDIDKPISTATQVALDAKQDTLAPKVYVFNKAVDILDIPAEPTWTPIVSVTSVTALSEKYEVKFVLTGTMADLNDAMRIRYRLNAGTWYTLSHEAKDTDDTWAFSYFFPLISED